MKNPQAADLGADGTKNGFNDKLNVSFSSRIFNLLCHDPLARWQALAILQAVVIALLTGGAR